MKQKYFLSDAYCIDLLGNGERGAGDELYLLKNTEGKIFGCSSEFELCTFDIAKASSCVKCNEVEWFSWDDVDLNSPATLEEIKQSGLLPFVIGYRNEWHCSEPIHPLEQI